MVHSVKYIKEMAGFPRIETARLLLRQITLDDVDAVFKHFSDTEVLKYMDFEPLKSKKQAEDVITWGIDIYTGGEGILWGIIGKESNTFIGTIQYVKKEENDRVDCAEITYDLARDYWGRGFMLEALQGTLSYVFEVMGITRIETTVHVQNFQSAVVLTKTGFRMEGILRKYKSFHGVYGDVMVFSLMRRDWQKQKS
jgi:ribosomal-protein-alanine N-acetyltransferase